MKLDIVPMEPVELWEELERAGDVPAAPDDALLAARAAVRRAATTETLRADVLRVRRGRRRLRIAAVVAATVATTLTLGLVRLDIGGHRVGPPSAAAAVLERAARVSLAESDPVVGAGQYLRITLVEQSWDTRVSRHGHVVRGSDGQLAVQEQRRVRTIWVPHDLHQDWVFRDGTRVIRDNTTDPRYRDPGQPTRTWSQPGWADRGSPSYIKTYDPRWYATLPRDPTRLIARLDKELRGEGSGLAYRFQEEYSEVLRSGIAPAAVRAALFQGLAELPGMAVQRRVTTLDGRSGIAIGARGSTWQMVFDTATGRYIGERATDPDFPDVAGLDQDKTTWLTSVTTTVVDHAPKAAPLDD